MLTSVWEAGMPLGHRTAAQSPRIAKLLAFWHRRMKMLEVPRVGQTTSRAHRPRVRRQRLSPFPDKSPLLWGSSFPALELKVICAGVAVVELPPSGSDRQGPAGNQEVHWVKFEEQLEVSILLTIMADPDPPGQATCNCLLVWMGG